MPNFHHHHCPYTSAVPSWHEQFSPDVLQISIWYVSEFKPWLISSFNHCNVVCCIILYWTALWWQKNMSCSCIQLFLFVPPSKNTPCIRCIGSYKINYLTACQRSTLFSKPVTLTDLVGGGLLLIIRIWHLSNCPCLKLQCVFYLSYARVYPEIYVLSTCLSQLQRVAGIQ